MKKNENCIAIYSRKSKFTGKGESIGNQIELCKEYVVKNYGEEMLDNIIVYEDEGFSGGNLNRPDFKQMMKAAKERKFKAIIVYRLDRISRNISDFAGLIEELSHLDIDFISIKEQFDTSSPMGRAMMYIASVFSQLERETIAERIRDNMHELAKTGRWLGGITPTGYESESVKSVTVDGKTKKACKLKIIPEQAEIVRTIFDLFIQNNSLTITEAELMRMGIKTKNNRHFTRFSLKSILQNPVYMIADKDAYNYFIDKNADLFSDINAFDNKHGVIAYNRTEQEKGKATVYLPIENWIIAVGQHEGIVSGEDWVKVQEILEQNKCKAFRRPRSNESLLTGILYCKCGNKMYPKLTKRETPEGKPIFTYVCNLKERSQRSLCNNKNVNGNTLDMAVIEQIKKLESNSSQFALELENSRKFYTGTRTDYEQRLQDLTNKKAELAKKIDALVDSLIDMKDKASRSAVSDKIENISKESESIDNSIKELNALLSQNVMNDEQFETIKQMLSMLSNGIDEMNLHQKRIAIKALVRKVIWDGENIHIIIFGASDKEGIEYPNMDNIISENDENEHLTEDLDTNIKSHQREDSERNTNAF